MPDELAQAVARLKERPRFGDMSVFLAMETRRKYYEAKCWRCEGRGKLPNLSRCELCEGSGRLWERKR